MASLMISWIRASGTETFLFNAYIVLRSSMALRNGSAPLDSKSFTAGIVYECFSDCNCFGGCECEKKREEAADEMMEMECERFIVSKEASESLVTDMISGIAKARKRLLK
jgi:hypothetical protein